MHLQMSTNINACLLVLVVAIIHHRFWIKWSLLLPSLHLHIHTADHTHPSDLKTHLQHSQLVNYCWSISLSISNTTRQHPSGIPFPQRWFNNHNYCYSCGYNFPMWHTSTTCPYQKPGHQVRCTQQNPKIIHFPKGLFKIPPCSSICNYTKPDREEHQLQKCSQLINVVTSC